MTSTWYLDAWSPLGAILTSSLAVVIDHADPSSDRAIGEITFEGFAPAGIRPTLH
jgi:hypothetical protein